jgi:succinate dehydrogenase / fumarate reductase cytochrome b subunit
MKAAAEPKAAPRDTFGAYLVRFFTSSVGAKTLMAITGLLLVIWILGHLVGNLLIFGGPDATNNYAHGLKSLGGLLWVERFGLLAIFLVHVLVALRTKLWDRESRPVRYQVEGTRAATFASRTMLVTGLIILAFVLYHLAHFTLGWLYPGDFAKPVTGSDDPLMLDVYSMVAAGFSRPGVSILYGAAMVVLGLHISHGISSLFQHLGLWGERFARWIRGAGVFVAVVVAVLFIVIPAAVLLGIVG